MEEKVKPVYETSRLVLRYWRKRDVVWLKKWGRDPRVAIPTGWSPVISYVQGLEMVMTGYQKPWAFAIEEKETQRVIGSLTLMPLSQGHFNLDPDELEIGYWIARPCWGKGYMKEALECVMDDLFENRGFQRIWCICAADNTQSIRVQEKLGFRYNKTENIWQQALGKHVPSRISLLDASDWRKLHHGRSVSESPGS